MAHIAILPDKDVRMLTNERIEQIDNMGLCGKWDLAESTNDVDILEYLSNDEDLYVRFHVARNVNTPVDILIKLSNDENGSVRISIVHNAHTPMRTLKNLLNDKHESVRNAVKKRLTKYMINIDKRTIKGILE